MKAGRHMGGKFKSGGAPKPYNAQGSNVEKEAEDEMNRGGVVAKRARGGRSEMRGEEERARGGRRMDRPGRKRGGGVGADKTPLTTASRTSPAQGHSTDEGGETGLDEG